LLQYARTGLDGVFECPVQRSPFMISYEMLQPHGVFSSLYVMSDHGTILRGCMGDVRSKLPLYKMAYQMTKQAACKDLRFYPLRQKELGNTILSLSVITDLKDIGHQYSEIKELDGLMLQYDDRVALSLPSEVSIHGWSYQSVLTNLSKQVSSRGTLWKKPRAKLFTFQSLVFQEE
jgi:AMMECR1 domain-containing protein